MLQRGVSALQTAITAAGRLWSAGFELDLELVNSMERQPLRSRPLVTLPRYPFNHKRRYWRESRGVRWVHGHPTPRTDLLGQKTPDYNSLTPTWRNVLCPSESPWLLDHKVHGLLVMPGAVYIAMVMEACRDTADPTRTLEAYEFRDITWHKPIVFESPDAKIQTSLQLLPYKMGTKSATTSTWTRFSITTIGANHEASEHCSGLVERKYVTRPGEIEKGIEAAAAWERHKAEYETLKARPTISFAARTMYDKMETLGFQFGPTFRNLFNMQSGEGFMHGEIRTPDTAATMAEGVEYALPLHPTVLDASFQMLAAAARGRSLDFALLPSSIESLYISATAPTAAGTVLKGYCTRMPDSSAVKASGCSVLSTEAWDRPVVVLKNLIITATPGPKAGAKSGYARLDWVVDVNHSRLPAELCVRYKKDSAEAARLCDKVAAKFMRETLALVGAPEAMEAENLPVGLRNYIAWMRSFSDSVADIDGIEHDQSTEPAPDGDALSIIVRVGTHINDILMGRETENTILSKAFLADFAHRSLGRSFVDSTVVEILDRAGNVNPNLEILEIASGSDATVATEVLKRLSGKYSRIAKYIWTGRDGEDVEAARNNISKPSEFIDFKTLDIEGDIQAQGFDLGMLDYIILDDLLLTTSDLNAALGNIKRLLKPDGKLVVQAITKAQLRTAFVLGSAPAWWRDGASGERLDEARWGELLRANGFTGVNPAFADSDDPAVHQLSVMLSSATRETAFEYTDVLLVTPPTPSSKVARLAENCAARLAGLGLGLAPTTLPWTELADDVLGKAVVVSLVELDGDVFSDLEPALFHATKAMALRAGGVLWLTQAGQVSGAAPPGHSVSAGLLRTVRSEYEARPLASLDLSAGVDLASAGAADLVTRLFTSLFAEGDIRAPDKEFAEDKGVVYVQRVVEDLGLAAARATMGVMPQPVADRLFQDGRKLLMTVGQAGVLDSLQFEDNDDCAGPLPHNKVEVKVLYTGLNFVDIMATLGEVPKLRLGGEVVGIVTDIGSSVTHVKPGDTVVGMADGGFASHARINARVCHHVPHNISIQNAATIPIAFATAWVGLVELAKIRKSETILIHSAAGGVGQAAVQICQHFGVEVFATVGSVPKKELLMRRYGVPEDHIFSSRDTTFAQGVRRMTHGRGVDLVLNSVAGEFLRQSWHLVAPFGRFVEIGKRDILGNTGLDMEPFIRNVSFIGLNLQEYTEDRPEYEVIVRAQKQIFELIAASKLRPLGPVTVYDFSDGPKAFRALQSGKTVGKIIMRANPDEMVPVVPRDEHPLSLDPNATYLLAGGLGGIGRSIATTLHAHGARNLAFVSKSGDAKDAAKAFLRQLRGLGCTANAYACDIADREQLSRAIEQCQSEMPPIKGSIQCAMMLRDGIFETMTYEDWVFCTRPKIQGSWNLHNVLPKDLDFFIMLASTSGVIGTPGQANYAAGNTFQDALANYRRSQGQKAVALDIGAVRDVGYLAETKDQRYWSMSHMALSVSEADIHFLVKHAITGYAVGNQAMGGQIIAGLAGAKIDESQVDRSPWVRDGKLCLALKDSLTKRTADMHAGLEALAKADTAAAAAAIVEEIMIRRVAVAVMISEDEIAVGEPLHTYGVNSLVAVEIKTWLAKEFQTEEISVGEVSPSSISTLAKRIVATSKLLRTKFKDNSEDAPATVKVEDSNQKSTG